MHRPTFLIVSIALLTSAIIFSEAKATNKNKVLNDFKSQYKQQDGRKQLSLTYVGKPRSFRQTEGLVKVPFKAYQVKLVDLFEACGLRVEYTWEVWYRRNKTFTQIAILNHKLLNTPPSPELLPNAKLISLIQDNWEKGSGHYSTKISSVSVVKQTAGWNFCLPKYEVELTINLTSGKSYESMHDAYECKAAAIVTKKGNEYEVNTNTCIDPASGKRTQCFYANHCKSLGKRSAITTLSWGDLARKVLEKGLCENATSNTRSNCKAASMKLLMEGPPSADSKKRTFKLDYQLTFTEQNMGRKERTDPYKITSRYQCYAQAEVEWNDSYELKWTVSDTKYCTNAAGPCDKEYTYKFFRICKCLGPASHCAGLQSN